MKTTNDIIDTSKRANTNHFLTQQLWGRLGNARVRQQLTRITTLFALAALLFVGVRGAWARPMFATAPVMGTSADFAVLAGSAVTNTGPTRLIGNLGVSPGTAITGFPPGVVTGGTIHNGDAVALQAQTDLTQAYNNLAGQPCDFDLTGQDLGGMTLTPGVYCFPNTSAQLTGALTLDGEGDPAAVFVFKIGSTLTTASNASVLLINGAADCNVYWQVGSSATLGTATSFVGNILALTSITMNTGADLLGRALARNGAVTMDTNDISSTCTFASPTNTPLATNTPVSTNTPIATNTQQPPINTSTPIATVNPLTPIATVNPLTPIATVNPLTPIATVNPLTPIATVNPLTPIATVNPLTPIATVNPLTPVATGTPIGPIGSGTPEGPTAIDPVGQPNASAWTYYLPFGIK